MSLLKISSLSKKNLGKKISVSGWVENIRDHGGVIFIDLREGNEILQVVVEPQNKEIFKVAESIRDEFVISVSGEINERPKGTINKKMITGEIELNSSNLSILSKSKPMPFQLDEYVKVGEETRLKYRYLDLRRSEMQETIRIRSKVSNEIRQFLISNDFLDIETPMMTKATPEGARDFVIPSRVNQGSFYALPQSPQLFKQLLMISGFGKYFQIVRCFRPRRRRDPPRLADRQADSQNRPSIVDQALSWRRQLTALIVPACLPKSSGLCEPWLPRASSTHARCGDGNEDRHLCARVPAATRGRGLSIHVSAPDRSKSRGLRQG